MNRETLYNMVQSRYDIYLDIIESNIDLLDTEYNKVCNFLKGYNLHDAYLINNDNRIEYLSTEGIENIFLVYHELYPQIVTDTFIDNCIENYAIINSSIDGVIDRDLYHTTKDFLKEDFLENCNVQEISTMWAFACKVEEYLLTNGK